MTLPLAISFGFALVAGGGCALLMGKWPRRVSAEEWVLHRRAASRMREAPHRSAWMPRVPILPPQWLGQGAYREAMKAFERDLQVARLSGSRAVPVTSQQFVEALAKAAVTGAVLGILMAVLAWRVGAVHTLWSTGFLLGLLGAVGGTALRYWQVHRAATRLRRAVIRRLPRVITGARMVMESGAATPEGALAMAVSLYADPASDLIREAIRMREVHKLSLEDALDRVGTEYGLTALGQLADAFRIGRRYGTPMSEILAGFAQELRREWHTAHRERITRAPVLMTIPALIFFVAPLLVLILYLVFSPLFTVLSQL